MIMGVRILNKIGKGRDSKAKRVEERKGGKKIDGKRESKEKRLTEL